MAIVSSGYSNDPVLANYQKFGFKEVVAKPYSLEDIAEVLDRVILQEGKVINVPLND